MVKEGVEFGGESTKEQEDMPEIDDEEDDGGTVEIIQHHVAQWLS